MVRNILSLLAIILLLSGCSSLKPLNFTSSRQVMSASANPETAPATAKSKQSSVKFIEDISVSPQPTAAAKSPRLTPDLKKQATKSAVIVDNEEVPATSFFLNSSVAIESASNLQFKYAVLLNTEVEQLQNASLLESIDHWYGTRYRMGGTTKSGVDCSAFVQAVFATAFAIKLPRTAREQYKVVQPISRTELKEGDLLFFNTRGGVSHVGMYLQNNKFIHASVSRGVTISDMYEPYYLQRFIGAGRLEEKAVEQPAFN